jgi:hypothetical protein
VRELTSASWSSSLEALEFSVGAEEYREVADSIDRGKILLTPTRARKFRQNIVESISRALYLA